MNSCLLLVRFDARIISAFGKAFKCANVVYFTACQVSSKWFITLCRLLKCWMRLTKARKLISFNKIITSKLAESSPVYGCFSGSMGTPKINCGCLGWKEVDGMGGLFVSCCKLDTCILTVCVCQVRIKVFNNKHLYKFNMNFNWLVHK